MAIVFRQKISDFVKANNFVPSNEMRELIASIKFQPESEIIVKATSPTLLNRQNFNQKCKNNFEGGSVLGCYKADEIFIFDIDNSELDGIKQTTLAHEALHAVWSRTPEAEKSRLKNLLNADYERIKTPKLEKTMSAYAVTQPGEHENELHSILGTEFFDLSPELEAHYSQIFHNRRAVVEFHKKYSEKFEKLEQDYDRLKTEVEISKKEIEAAQQDYSAKIEAVNSQIVDFNQKAKNGDFSSQWEFGAERSKLLQKTRFLDDYREQINSQIANFNAKIKELNNISIKSQELHQAMDSNLPESSPSL